MTPSQKRTIYALLHELVRLRDKDRCLRCQKREWQLSHIYPKGKHRKMEFDPDNVKALCYACHIHWWHKNPIEAHEWLAVTIDKQRLMRLKIAANTVNKSTIDYYAQKMLLESEIKKLLIRTPYAQERNHD